jgi:EAL domain-containing protein (putative c-di-GMP-specific phosphodiesterase class I)
MNVSRVHLLNDDIIGYITSLFDEFKIPPQLVEFELTENIYMSNMTNARKFMNFCKSFGIFVSMDDFGSGFSSLNVMNSLPIDIIKLDRVFLKNETLTENDKIVLECIISMAKRLKMKVICEGVETSNQSKFLKEAQCDMIQGYYYGRPMDEESFNRYIEEHWAE